MGGGGVAAGFGENDGGSGAPGEIFSFKRANVPLQSGENMVKYS